MKIVSDVSLLPQLLVAAAAIGLSTLPGQRWSASAQQLQKEQHHSYNHHHQQQQSDADHIEDDSLLQLLSSPLQRLQIPFAPPDQSSPLAGLDQQLLVQQSHMSSRPRPPPGGLSSPGKFDDKIKYYPIFYTKKPTKQYEQRLQSELRKNDVEAIAIPTSQESEVLNVLRNKGPLDPLADDPPFAGWEPRRIYDFFRNHVAPHPDAERPYHFSSFTFLVVGDDCELAAAETSAAGEEDAPPEIWMCCDAPDESETGVITGQPGDPELRLKRMPADLNDALAAINELEALSMTPTEYARGADDIVLMNPNPWFVPVGETDGGDAMTYQLGTPRQARRNKLYGLQMMAHRDAAQA